MERSDTPRMRRRHGGSIERKTFSSDEEKTAGRRRAKVSRTNLKHSTPVDHATPNETVPELSRIVKSKSSSSDEVKRPKKAQRKIRLEAKRPESTKIIEYSDDDDVWETEEEHEETSEERRSWWAEASETECNKEYLREPEREFETEPEERSPYVAEKSSGKKIVTRGKDFHLISEEKRDELFRNEESRLFQSPEKIRREAVREDRGFQSPVKISHLSLRKVHHEIEDDVFTHQVKELPPLNIQDEKEIEEEDIFLKRESIKKTYPVKTPPCEANFSFPVFRPTDSKDFLWEEYIEEYEDEINERVHNLWSKDEKRKRFLSNYLKDPVEAGSRKKFFRFKNKPASPSANVSKKKVHWKNRSATKDTSEQSIERTKNTDLSAYDVNVKKMYGEGTKIRMKVKDVEEKHPNMRKGMSEEKSKRRARAGRRSNVTNKEIRMEILDCEMEIRECNKEIRCYENAMLDTKYRESPWSSMHSFQDWGDTMMAFAGPKKTAHESEVTEIFAEWSDENPEDSAGKIEKAPVTSPVKKAVKRLHENPGGTKNYVRSSTIRNNSGESGRERLEFSSQVGEVPKKTPPTARNVLRENKATKIRGNQSRSASPISHYSPPIWRQLEESEPPCKARKIQRNILKVPQPSFSYKEYKNILKIPALSLSIKENEEEEISSSIFSVSLPLLRGPEVEEVENRSPCKKRGVSRKVDETVSVYPQVNSSLTPKKNEEDQELSSPIFRFTPQRAKKSVTFANKDATRNRKPSIKSSVLFTKRVKIV